MSVFLNAGVQQRLQQAEQAAGCKEGALSGAFPAVSHQDTLSFQFMDEEYQRRITSSISLIWASITLSAVTTVSGLAMNVSPMGKSLTPDQAVTVGGFFMMATAIGIFVTNGTQKICNRYEAERDYTIQEFRARIPHHLLK